MIILENMIEGIYHIYKKLYMNKKKRKEVFMKEKTHKRRIRNLLFGFAFLAVFLTAATFAWFIGMRTVNVTPFDINIAAVDQLSLSLDGVTWTDELTISASTLNAMSYTGHTNKWAGRGLIPMSTISDMDTSASRMMLFEKASMTATPGGYRLLASRVDNYNDPNEMPPDGYVVFDLFIRNLTGREYYPTNDVLNEEAIYLTVNSEVTVAEAGVRNTGIENSARVAFAQIGRVEATPGVASQSDIVGITCDTQGIVTGICRDAQIWEPNDRAHVAGAISWYDLSCRERTGPELTLASAYEGLTFPGGKCKPLSDGLYYRTYVVTDEIGSGDKVDIYDGEDYNLYAGTALLKEAKSFTDTMKNFRGTYRPQFFSLAPNSITKVRVYVYIEGQDIDNYDFAAIGKAISVNFGFTKERFTEDDVNYAGPDLNQGGGPNIQLPDLPDRTPPVITIQGPNPLTIPVGSVTSWIDALVAAGETAPGATAVDNLLLAATNSLTYSGTVNVNFPGTYIITYKAVDDAGNVATKTRSVIVTP